MLRITNVSVAICLVVAVLAHGEDRPSGDEGALDRLNRDLLALEREWQTTSNPSYFSKASRLVRVTRHSQLMVDPRCHTFILDLTCGVLLKSRDGTEFDMNAESAVRSCQNKVVDELASVDPSVMTRFEAWPELRARYTRLMMIQRARWISLRDPSLDGPIMLDSTQHLGAMEPDPAKRAVYLAAEEAANKKRLIQNQQASLQYDVKKFMADTGPEIDRFMIAAFSAEPADFRMLNELLLMGRYTAEARTTLVNLVAGSTQRLPEVLRTQLAQPAIQSPVEKTEE